MSDNHRELRYVRFYKDRVNVGREGYNPAITLYYNSTDDLIKIREEWRGEVWEQTISGTGMGDQTVTYQHCYDAWIKI
jgi:hypothetical protein